MTIRCAFQAAAAVALLLFATTLSLAAELPEQKPAKAEPAAAPPALTWSGPYVGLFAGYSWGRARSTSPHDSNSGYYYNWTGNAYSADTDGFFGGGTLGANCQSGPLVFGLEGEIGYMQLKGSAAEPNFSRARAPLRYGHTIGLGCLRRRLRAARNCSRQRPAVRERGRGIPQRRSIDHRSLRQRGRVRDNNADHDRQQDFSGLVRGRRHRVAVPAAVERQGRIQPLQFRQHGHRRAEQRCRRALPTIHRCDRQHGEDWAELPLLTACVDFLGIPYS